MRNQVITRLSKIKKYICLYINTDSSLSIILKNFSWIFTGKIFYAISSLVVNIVVTRSLGPDNNGVFNYVLAFTTLFSALSGMGLESIVVKEFNTNNNQSGSILFSGFILKLCGGISACILSISVAYFIELPYEKIIYVTIISISFIFQAFDIILYWFQSQSYNKVAVSCQNLIRTLFIILKLFLSIYKVSLQCFVFVTMMETIALSVCLPIIYKYNYKKASTLSFKKEIFVKLLKFSWPLILSDMAVTIFMKIDQIMIGKSMGDYELGIYSVAVRLAESWYFIPMSIVAAVLPFMTRVSEQSEEKFYRLLQVYADGMTLIAYTISIGITIFSRPLIYLLFGKEYISADNLLTLYVWAGVFVNFGLIRGNFVTIKGCTKISMYGTIMGAFCNIVFNLWLIPLLGAKGAVWATIITQILASFLSSFMFKETRKLALSECYSLFPFIRLYKLFKVKCCRKG